MPKVLSPKIVVIGSSTGGPDALEKIFTGLIRPVGSHLMIAQHMPAGFTSGLAELLSSVSGFPVVEAVDRLPPQLGTGYIAPGDHHLEVHTDVLEQKLLKLNRDEKRNFVRPSVDYLFESAARAYKNRCLAIILTGMGSDGKEGAEYVRHMGGEVWIQSAASCVVNGMPKSVRDVGAFDREGDLEEIRSWLNEIFNRQSDRMGA